MKIGVIGLGKIGQAVVGACLEEKWEVVGMDRGGIYRFPGKLSSVKFASHGDDWIKHFKDADIAVLAISTLDDGFTAYKYIKRLAGENGIPVVTCEKGAFGNYFPELKPLLPKIGYSAVVGGGTRMLHWLKNRLAMDDDIREIHLVLNGTMNYCLDGWSRGRAPEEVIQEAIKLGYAEPGSKNALGVINMETCRDVPMKVASLLNICGLGETPAKGINVQILSKPRVKKLIREAMFRRHIVSLLCEPDGEEDVLAGFEFTVYYRRRWHVSGGFKNTNENPLFRSLVPPGVNNAALVCGAAGTYVLSGPGAGEKPTAGAILDDIKHLIMKK